jgi:hypothetical protein
MRSTSPSCGLLVSCIVQMGLLISLFFITGNSQTDTYFLYHTEMSIPVLSHLDFISNQTHAPGWLGPTFPVVTDFSVIPINAAVGLVFMLALFIQAWTYHISTTTDMTMEPYTPETLMNFKEWDMMFIIYIAVEHAIVFAMLCTPIPLTFLMLHVLLITVAIIERCAPRPDGGGGRDGANQQFAMLAVFAGVFVAFHVLSQIKRHTHSSGVFFITHIFLDLLLVLGHTWDARDHQFATTMNSRSFFVLFSSVIIFSMFVSHCKHLVGQEIVTDAVNNMYTSTTNGGYIYNDPVPPDA